MNAASAIVNPPPPRPLFIWFAIGLVYGLAIGATAAIAYCHKHGC